MMNIFSRNFQTDEEIVYNSNYQFSSDIEKLLNNSTTTRRAERIERTGIVGNPPKCQNAFMLYRRDKMASPEFTNRPAKERRAPDISKEISNRWKEEPEDVKSLFHALARMAEERHSKRYGQRTEEDETMMESKKPVPFQQIQNNNFMNQEQQFQHPLNNTHDNNQQFLLPTEEDVTMMESEDIVPVQQIQNNNLVNQEQQFQHPFNNTQDNNQQFLLPTEEDVTMMESEEIVPVQQIQNNNLVDQEQQFWQFWHSFNYTQDNNQQFLLLNLSTNQLYFLYNFLDEPRSFYYVPINDGYDYNAGFESRRMFY
ncbi:hypothetical protein C1645_872290 [Glomus cerebriforme]|uniref:HMG box domain-containing protein n=1 Tax=Glomus cerebriforme TaxID=658196 RepID=A0A397TM74_9GLOM|nr:hypothetical protein C1645_872290 [Glomus cerebriforme]